MTQSSRSPNRHLDHDLVMNMPSRAQKNRLWVMLAGLLVAFCGAFVYAYLNASAGYAIAVTGIIVGGIGVITNIGISIRENRDR